MSDTFFGTDDYDWFDVEAFCEDWLCSDQWWCDGWTCLGGEVTTRRRHRLTMQHFIDTDRRTLTRRYL